MAEFSAVEEWVGDSPELWQDTNTGDLYSFDIAGNLILDSTGEIVVPATGDFGGDIPTGLGTQSPGDIYWMDDAGNIINEQGAIVLSASDAAVLLGDTTPVAYTLTGQPLTQSEVDALGPDAEQRFAAGSLIPATAIGGPTQPGGTVSRINTLLRSPLGALLTTLGLGGAGIGLSQLIARGGDDRITIPQPPQTAGQQALSDLFSSNPAAASALQEAILRSLQGGATGAQALADELTRALAASGVEEPLRAMIRNAALSNLAALAQGAPPMDPVTGALQRQILSITAEGTTNPALQRAFREQRDVLGNRMFLAQGPEWQLSTPGIDAATKLQESQHIQNYADWLNTIGALTGPYQAGVKQETDISTGLSALGLPDIPRTVTALGSLAGPSAVGGIGTTNQQALTAQQAQDEAALLSAFSAQRARMGLGQSIANLAGLATQNAFQLAA